MSNNKGQALVEFVIILPIFLLLIISVIDFGNILTKKYSLENDIDLVADLYEQEKYEDINKYLAPKKIKFLSTAKNDLHVITLKKNVNITSPVLVLIFGNTYDISVEKSIYKNE